LEVLAGVVVFAFGILALYRLQATTLGTDSFANDLAQAVALGQSRMEALMALNYDNPALNDTNNDGGANQDVDKNGVDDDDVIPGSVDGILNFGLDISVDANNLAVSDGSATSGKFNLYWNVAVDQPVTNIKTIRLIITWQDSRNALHRIVMDCMKTDII